MLYIRALLCFLGKISFSWGSAFLANPSAYATGPPYILPKILGGKRRSRLIFDKNVPGPLGTAHGSVATIFTALKNGPSRHFCGSGSKKSRPSRTSGLRTYQKVQKFSKKIRELQFWSGIRTIRVISHGRTRYQLRYDSLFCQHFFTFSGTVIIYRSLIFISTRF